MKKSLATLAVLLIILMIGGIGVTVYDPTLLNSLNPNSVLGVNVVNVEPQGTGGAGTGSYWTILATTDMVDQYDAIKFDDTSQTANWASASIKPSSDIEIDITPQQPYWSRSLNVAAYQVYPTTQTYQQNKITQQSTWTQQAVAQALSCSVWTWGQSFWTAHTPFTVTVLKNGAVWQTQQYDSAGISQAFKITNPNNPNEWISLKNIGVLSAGYGQPSLPDIAMLSQSVIYPYSSALINDINYGSSDYSYANYWFGGGNYYTAGAISGYSGGGFTEQKASDGSPGLYVKAPGLGPAPLFLPGTVQVPLPDRMFPGEYRSDDSGNYKVLPLPADEFNDKPVALSSTNGKSLNNYLSQTRGFVALTNNQMNVYGSGWLITNPKNAGPDGTAGYVDEMMPKGAMSSLITIQISTAMADAIVNKPPVSNGKIVSMSWLGGNAQIGDTSTLYVNIRQDSTVTSDIDLYATATAGNNIFLNPTSQKVTLAPGATQQVAISVLNNGAATSQSGSVTVVLKDELGDVTDTSTIAYTLLPKGVGNTQLLIYTQDGDTNELISGIPVAVDWGTNSQLLTSGSSGQGACNLDLVGYTGSVNVVSSETSAYQSASGSVNVGLGQNTLTLKIYKIGETPPNPFNWILVLEIIGIAAAIAVIGGAGFAVHKKMKHGHRRR